MSARLERRPPQRLARAWMAALLVLLPMASAWADTELNRANQAELEMLKGVGPDLSGRILAERERGPFKDWRDFESRVPGIGPVRAAKLSSAGLRVNGATSPAQAPRPSSTPASTPASAN